MLFLTRKEDVTNENFEVTHHFENESKLKGFILQFEADENIKNGVVTFEKNEDIIETFRASFKYIEAAGGLVENPTGQFLFIFRLNKWDLPKGKAETGEQPDETAIREIKEECGIEVSAPAKKITDTFHTYKLNDELVLKRTHWFKFELSKDQSPVPQAEENIEQVVWLNKDEMDLVKKNTYPSILDVLNQEGI